MMLNSLRLPAVSALTLQDQVCEVLSAAIAQGLIDGHAPLPSCRVLAQHFAVSKNTVASAYLTMIDSGLVIAKNRSGYFVDPKAAEVLADRRAPQTGLRRPFPLADKLRLGGQFASDYRKVQHPVDWGRYPFPFVYNQIDPKLFPIRQWRDCMRQTLNLKKLADWSGDSGGADSPELVRRIQQRLLSYRGLQAEADEILVTSGAQNAIYLMAMLFGQGGQTVAVEDPGYPEARNAFAMAGARVVAVPVDDNGLRVGDIPDGCSLVYTTPSHQFPTTVTMSDARRLALLDMAARKGFVICEDDYEAEMNFVRTRGQPMRAQDQSGLVVYIGSLSKALAPGLRLGYLVAHPDIIREAKAMRRVILRHPPTLLQDTMALFLTLGHQDAHLQRLHRRYKARWQEMQRALALHLPGLRIQVSQGGTSVWIVGPAGLDTAVLASGLRADGVLIDEGSVFFANPAAGRNVFRLGFAAVPLKAIEPGVCIIAAHIAQLMGIVKTGP
ncbi:PLP-dependent aminotransferase family protein [Pseudorhodobacter sp. W20_MBD10_FR17]|uniref:MocR-like pyridoxine biosynthesis transcription factor PdxR n=1 Tax=Pseudorhodobacter sp. W20_MBD10_FR17 TaxID=3240266 RepID=UPI003F95D798